MKNRIRTAQGALKRAAYILAALMLAQPVAQAATLVKTATGTDLTVGTNWIGGVAPVTTDTASWTSTNSLGAGLTLGTSQSWNSMTVVDASTNIDITGAGTLTLSGSGIDMSSALVNLSIGNPITLGANSIWNVGLTKTLTASGVVGESGGARTLTKSGVATLKLTNANSFSGVTTISGGALVMQNAAALGTVANLTTVSSGGTLELQGGITVTAKTLSLNGAGAVIGTGNANEGNSTQTARALGGALRNGSGNNTFSGAITLAGATRINSLAGTLTLNSGTAINGSGNALSVGGVGNITISSVLGTSGGLVKDGAGTLTFNGSSVNTFTGGIVLNNGTLLADFVGVGATANLLNSGNALTMGGGTLLIKAKDSSTAANQTLGNVTIAPGASMASAFAGSGGQILLNPNGGSATLTLGTLTNSATVGGALLMGQTADSGTATITTTSAKDGAGIYAGGRVVYTTDGGTAVDWATTISGSSPYTLSSLVGGSYSTLPASGGSSAVNYIMTGGTTLAGSFSVNTLKLENPGGNLVLGANTLTFSGSGLLCSGSTAANITGTAGGTRLTGTELIVHQYNTGGLTISAVIGGTTILTKAGSQKLTLSGANTHTGVTYLNAGTLNLANQNALSGSTLNMNGGTLTFDSSVSGNAFTISGVNSVNTGSGYDIGLTNSSGSAIALTLGAGGGTVYGDFSGSGSLVIAGGMTLYGVKTYSGSTTINSGGTLNLGGNRCYSGIPNSSNIVINGTLRLQHGATPLVQGIDLARSISGSGNLSVAGGAVILHGTNTFSGGVLFDQNNDGCLYIDNDHALGTGTISIVNNEYLGSVDTTPHTLGNNIVFSGLGFNFGKVGKSFGGTGDLTFTGTVALATSVRSLTVWDTTTVTFSGIVSGTGGGIIKLGTGVLALAGGATGNTYTGNTTNSAGTLTFLKKIAQPASGTTTVAAGAALGLGVGGTITYFSTGDVDALWANPCTLAGVTMDPAALVGIDTSAGNVTYGTAQATRGLVKLGTNTLTITGTHSYTGATTVIGGTLQVNGSTATGSAVVVKYGGTLGGTGTVNGAVTVDAGGALSLGSSGATLKLTSSTAPAFAAFSKLNVVASGGTLDKIFLSHATPVFSCSNIDLVIDTTGLDGTTTGATIVQTGKGNGGISGTFNSISANLGATVIPHYNTATGTITVDIITLKPRGTAVFIF